MHPDLESVRQQLNETRLRGIELMDMLTADQLNWRPAPGVWTIAENLDHLSVTADVYAESIAAALRNAQRDRTNGPFHYGWLETRVVRTIEPPAKMKFKAPKNFVPPPAIDPGAMRKHWDESHDAMQRLIQQSDGLALDKVKVRSPAIRFLKASLGMCFRIIAAHERRHLWQIGNVKTNPAFPRATREAASQ
jgi:hypothetical protein